MINECGLSLPLVLLVFLGNATRAVAPWLLMPAALLVFSALAGLDALTTMAGHESPVLKFLIAPLEGLPGWSGVYVVFALFVLLSLIIAWWPMRMLGLSGVRRAHQLPHPAAIEAGDDPGRGAGEQH